MNQQLIQSKKEDPENLKGKIIIEIQDDNGNSTKKITYNIDAQNNNVTTYYPFKEFVHVRITNGTIFNETYIYLYDKLIAKINQDGSKLFYHPDHLGSTSLVTNQSGDVVQDVMYLPFGKVLIGTSEERFLYTGKEWDKESELLYYGARYYDPEFSRFLQPDPVIQGVYNPQNLNHYSYVLNNPYKYVDPDGEVAISVELINTVGVGDFLSGTVYGVAYVGFNPGLAGVGGSGSIITYSREITGGTSVPGTAGVGLNLGISVFTNNVKDFASPSQSGELGFAGGGGGISYSQNSESFLDKLMGLSLGTGVGVDKVVPNFKDVSYGEAEIRKEVDLFGWLKRKVNENNQLNTNSNTLSPPLSNSDNDGGGSNFADVGGATPGPSGSSGSSGGSSGTGSTGGGGSSGSSGGGGNSGGGWWCFGGLFC